MSKFVLSKAMGAVPDEMLLEATEIKKKKSVGWVIFRAAACLAVVIGLLFAALSGGGVVTGPGLLSITAHAVDGDPFLISAPDTVVSFSHNWGPFVNWAPGWPLILSVTDENYDLDNIRFQVTVDGGGYYVGVDGGASIYPGLSKKMPAEFSVPNNTAVFWSMFYDAASGESALYEGDKVYTQIIVYDGEYIVGYTVLLFDRFTYGELNAEYYEQLGVSLDEYANKYQLKMLESVSFPKRKGEYQNITLEYVNSCIVKACLD